MAARLIKVPPKHFVHIQDINLNTARLLVGPVSYTTKVGVCTVLRLLVHSLSTGLLLFSRWKTNILDILTFWLRRPMRCRRTVPIRSLLCEYFAAVWRRLSRFILGFLKNQYFLLRHRFDTWLTFMISPPNYYVIVMDPIVLQANGEPKLDEHGQVMLHYGREEVVRKQCLQLQAPLSVFFHQKIIFFISPAMRMRSFSFVSWRTNQRVTY